MAASTVPKIRLNSGYDFPQLGLGTFHNFKENREIYEAVKTAIDIGYRHIDTAFLYNSEREIGEAIVDKIKEGVVKREELFIVTKLWNTSHAPEKVEPELRQSLAALQTDYVDLYLIHWPIACKQSPDAESKLSGFQPDSIDLVKTWMAMEKLVDAGLVKSIGVSNFNERQLTRLLEAPGVRIKPANNQIEIHPYLTNSDLLNFCLKKGISVTAYCPLALAGTTHPCGTTAPSLSTEPVIQTIARKRNKTPAQVVLRWGTQRGYAVIPKSVTPSRIKENFEIFDFTLNDEDVQAISSLDRGFKLVSILECKDYPEYPF